MNWRGAVEKMENVGQNMSSDSFDLFRLKVWIVEIYLRRERGGGIEDEIKAGKNNSQQCTGEEAILTALRETLRERISEATLGPECRLQAGSTWPLLSSSVK